MKTELEFVLDIFFEDDFTAVKNFVEVFRVKPYSIWKKGDKMPGKRNRINEVTRFNYRYKVKEDCDSLTEAMKLFLSPIIDNKSAVKNFLVERNAEVQLYIYLGEIDRRFDMSIEGIAKEILKTLNCDICFDTSYAKFFDNEDLL